MGAMASTLIARSSVAYADSICTSSFEGIFPTETRNTSGVCCSINEACWPCATTASYVSLASRFSRTDPTTRVPSCVIMTKLLTDARAGIGKEYFVSMGNVASLP
ncbi:hypothetical protein B0H14DRAFT_2716087 [Mycena olivaceomarginata]|nr:hypothetical protein B0H14DRAFT_2716087 [Mycena olivaceomarginata]